MSGSARLRLRWITSATADFPLPASPTMRTGSSENDAARAGVNHSHLAPKGARESFDRCTPLEPRPSQAVATSFPATRGCEPPH
jgi:hypothetical protein